MKFLLALVIFLVMGFAACSLYAGEAKNCIDMTKIILSGDCIICPNTPQARTANVGNFFSIINSIPCPEGTSNGTVVVGGGGGGYTGGNNGGTQSNGGTTPTTYPTPMVQIECKECRNNQEVNKENGIPCTPDEKNCTYDVCVDGVCDHLAPEVRASFVDPKHPDFNVGYFEFEGNNPPVIAAQAIVSSSAHPELIFKEGLITWTGSVKFYAYCPKTGANRTIQMTIPSQTTSPTGIYMYSFDKVRGGDLTLKATLIRNGIECASKEIKTKIKGKNPSCNEIKEYLESLFPNDPLKVDILLHIICKESHFRQFNGSGSLGGLPNKGCDPPSKNKKKKPTIGWGLMQITSNDPTDDEIFDWQLNIIKGSAIYEEKKAKAISYLGGHGYTDEELKYEILKRYNGMWYWNWDGNKWVRRPQGKKEEEYNYNYPTHVLKCVPPCN